jgi:hypothetical protein
MNAMQPPFSISIFALLLLSVSGMSSAQSPEFWMATQSHPTAGKPLLMDAAAMFEPDSPWKYVAAHTNVLELGPGDVLLANDEQLTKVFANIRERHLAFALQTSLLGRTATCQAKNEAYWDDLAKMDKLFAKVKRDGGDIKYLAMDGPYYFGHRWDGPTACHESGEAIAGRIKVNMVVLHHYFPNAQVGDIEGADASLAWTAELGQWADIFQRVTGQKLAFLQTDINWSTLTMQHLVNLAAELRQRHIPLGIIINSDGNARTDKAWTNSAMAHVAEIEGALGIHPGQEIVETWTDNPTRALPETQAGTLTNVAYRVLQSHPLLQVTRGANGVTGRLTDAAGHPISHAQIELQGSSSHSEAFSTQSLQDVVPAKAKLVMIAIRGGNEGACVCNGPVQVRLGPITFRPDGGKAVTVDPGKMRVMQLTAGSPLAATLQEIPVTPGTHYTLQAQIAAPSAATHAGYVTAIFLDASRHGIGRVILWFQPGDQTTATVETDDSGVFRAPSTATRFFYAATPLTRPTMTYLKP